MRGIVQHDCGKVVLEIRQIGGPTAVRSMGCVADWNHQRCTDLLGLLGLRRSERVDSLSLGGRVKLSLLLALARDARLLLLDEPTIGRDPLARQQLYAELLALMHDEEGTVVISSHQLGELERCADYVAIVNEGQLVASGATRICWPDTPSSTFCWSSMISLHTMGYTS